MNIALFQLGGLAGILLVGFIVDGSKPRKVIAAAYVGGAGCVFAIGLLAINSALLGALVLLPGFCIKRAQTGLKAYAPALYPMRFRATGVSWMLGTGRFVGIAASLVGGTLQSVVIPFCIWYDSSISY